MTNRTRRRTASLASDQSSHPRSRSRSGSDSAGPKFVVAFNLGREVARNLGARGEERRALVDVALGAGQWLADAGRPGRWDTLEPGPMLEAYGPLPEAERDGILLHLAALLGHAGLHGHVDPVAVQRNLAQIAELTASAPVQTFARHTAAQMMAMVRASVRHGVG